MVKEFLANFLNAIKSQQLYIKIVAGWIFITFCCIIYFIFNYLSFIDSSFELFVLCLLCFGTFFSLSGLLFLYSQLKIISNIFDVLIKGTETMNTSFVSPTTNNISDNNTWTFKSKSKDNQIIRLNKPIELSSNEEIENLIKWAEGVDEFEFIIFLQQELERRKK